MNDLALKPDRKSMLIIDDEVAIINSLNRQFKRKYTVFSASNTEDALRILQTEDIQLIISDQRMPGMTGVDFFNSIKSSYPDCIKLILTGFTDIEAAISAINHRQVFRYITKPWHPDELDSIVKEGFEKYDLLANNKKLMADLVQTNANLEKTVKLRTAKLELSNKNLKESEERFQLLFNKAPLGYQSLDNRGCFLQINQQWTTMLGYQSDEIIGKWFGDFLTPRFREEFRNRFPLLLQQVNFQCEFQMIHKNGSILFIAFDGKVGTDAEGNFVQAHCILQDITEIKKVREKLLKSESKFRNFFENSVVSKSITSIDGSLNVNNAFCEMLGYSEKELLGMNWKQITHKDDIEPNISIVNSILNGEIKSKRWEKRYIRKDGQTVWTDINTILQRDKDDKPLFFITEMIDITDRKKSQEALMESEGELHSIIDISPMPIAIIRDWKTIYLNPAAVGILGATQEAELLNKPILDIIHPDYHKLTYENSALLAENGYVSMQEQKYIKVNGTVLDVETQAKRIQYKGEQATLVVINDITDRKKAEDKLQKSELTLKTVLDNFPGMVFWKDKNSNYMGSNIGFARQAGLKDVNELIGLSDYDLPWTKTEAELYRTADAEVIQLGKPKLHIVETLEKKDGSLIWLDTSKVPFTNGNNEILGMIGVSTDITERKLAEDALRKSEQKLSSLFATMTEMVVNHEVVYNELNEIVNYKIIDCNAAFSEITGIKRENAIGKLATEVFQTDEPPYIDIYKQVVTTGKPEDFSTYYEALDKHFLISVVATGPITFSTITSDISSIQKVQELLKNKNKELESYIYVTSHDLRTPLVNIQGFSQRLENQIKTLKKIISENHWEQAGHPDMQKLTDEDIPKSLSYILSNVSKMDLLISSLLNLSRTGRVVLTVNEIDMNRLIRNILLVQEFELTQINAKLEIDNLMNCYGDENLLNQVFSNIINNAVKYRDSSRNLQIQISSEKSRNKVVYKIKDNGIGIKEELYPKIWDVFYRINPYAASQGEGIGLSLAKKIVEKHTGRTWVESVPNVGSTFFVELPMNKFEE